MNHLGLFRLAINSPDLALCPAGSVESVLRHGQSIQSAHSAGDYLVLPILVCDDLAGEEVAREDSLLLFVPTDSDTVRKPHCGITCGHGDSNFPGQGDLVDAALLRQVIGLRAVQIPQLAIPAGVEHGSRRTHLGDIHAGSIFTRRNIVEVLNRLGKVLRLSQLRRGAVFGNLPQRGLVRSDQKAADVDESLGISEPRGKHCHGLAIDGNNRPVARFIPIDQRHKQLAAKSAANAFRLHANIHCFEDRLSSDLSRAEQRENEAGQQQARH